MTLAFMKVIHFAELFLTEFVRRSEQCRDAMNERSRYVISNLSTCEREASLQREACSFCLHNQEVHS